jgi:hypothetical protein
MRINLLKVIFGLIVLIGFGTGCSRPSATISETATQNQPNSSALPDPAIVAQIKAAEKLGVPKDSIAIVSITATEFADSSLDCPQAGMAYAQVITPGYRVVTRNQSEEIAVNVSGGRGVICDSSFRSPR